MTITRRDTVILGLAGGALLADAARAETKPGAKPVTLTPEQER